MSSIHSEVSDLQDIYKAEKKMNSKGNIDPMKKLSDLTEQNLTKIFRKYFEDQTLSIKILEENQKFLGANDNFKSDIKKFHLREESINSHFLLYGLVLIFREWSK